MHVTLQPRKRNRTRTVILASLVLGAISFGVGIALKASSLVKDAPAEAQAASMSTGPTQMQTSSQEQPDSAAAELAQTVAGIRITLSNPRREGDTAKFDVCYPFPGAGDWLLSGISLQYDGQVIEDVQGTPIQAGDASRCDILSFKVPLTAKASSTFTLTIASLRSTPREGQECLTYLTTIQNALDATASGIKLACTQGDGGANVKIIAYPPTMTEAQAQGIAFSGDQLRIRGPWTFTGHTK